MNSLIARPLLLAALLAAVSGCDQSTPTQPQPSTQATQPAQPAQPPKNVVTDTVRTVTNAVQQATEVVAKTEQQVQQVVQQASAQAQGIIDQATSLLQAKKIQDAAPLLDQLSSMTLSPDQQKLLGNLKTEFSKLTDDIKNGIQKAQTLVSQKNYTEALSMLSSLSSYQLSADQKKLVDDVKAEAQRLLGKSATDQGKKALGNLLSK
jgi:hypothetical protein